MRRGTHRLLGVLAAFPLVKAAMASPPVGLWGAIYAFAAPYLLVAFAGAVVRARLRKLLDAVVHGVAVAGILALMRLSLLPVLQGPGWWDIPISDAAGAFGRAAGPVASMVLAAYYAERGGRFPDLDWTRAEELRIRRGVVSRERLIHRVLLHNLVGLGATTAALAAATWGRLALAPILVASWAAGYAAHLASDALTKTGCAIAYPFSRRLYLRDALAPAKRRLLLGSGGWGEAAIDALAVAALVALVAAQPPIRDLLESIRI